MVRAFYWECEDFRLAVAPWRNDPKLQRVVRARVAVAEQRTPGFALRFDLELLENEAENAPSGHLMRLVNQRQMLRAFEFAFVGVEAKTRQSPGGEGRDEKMDKSLKNWLRGDQPPPPKEELAKWLLGWMLVTPSDTHADEWVVLMCGEKGAEVEDNEEINWQEAGDRSEPVYNGEGDDSADDGSEETEDDDFPPPYEEIEETELEFSPDEQAPQLRETSRASNSRNGLRSIDRSVAKVSKRGSSIRSSSSRSLTNTSGSSGSVGRREMTELKPTIVRLNPRFDSLDMVKLHEEEQSDEWSESRRNFSSILYESRREIQIAKQKLDRAEKLAQLRHTQLLKESARLLNENEKKRRDAQAVRQLVADTLEYRDELRAVKSRMRNASITAHRNQERVKWQTRAALGHTAQAFRQFGPPTKEERDLLFGTTYSNNRDKTAVYDLHGRHHNSEDADQVANDTALESALGKIRRLFLNSVESIDIFRQYDLDRSGTLSYTEFQRMLREYSSGDSAELTKEQSTVLFKRFDSDGNGEIDYVELLWGFFNWEAFLKRWYEQQSDTTGSADQKASQIFNKFDPAGRGIVPLKEFQIVMDHLGVTLNDVDAKLLGVKFDAGKDDCIDYRKFLKSMNLFESQDELPGYDHPPKAQSEKNPDTPSGMERIWMELQELSTTQVKLHRLLQK